MKNWIALSFSTLPSRAAHPILCCRRWSTQREARRWPLFASERGPELHVMIMRNHTGKKRFLNYLLGHFCRCIASLFVQVLVCSSSPLVVLGSCSCSRADRWLVCAAEERAEQSSREADWLHDITRFLSLPLPHLTHSLTYTRRLTLWVFAVSS